MVSNIAEKGSDGALELRLQDLIAKQRKSCIQEGLDITKRINRIERTIALLVENSNAIVEVLNDDFNGRSPEGSLVTDVFGTLSALKYARKNIKRWARPSRRRSLFPLGLFGASTRIEYQALGSVGTVVPWNFPFNLCFGPLGSIFAAGNRVIIKPSEYTPASSKLIEELIDKYFMEEEASVVLGGPEVGAVFCRQSFDHLLFTGSTSVASSVMKSAAENLVPVTLELGGKSPVIVSDTADIRQTATRVMAGKTLNAGQICLAPDYVLINRRVVDKFISEANVAVGKMFPTMSANPDYTSIINKRHRERLESLLNDARTKGAELIELKPINEAPFEEGGGKMPPYLILSPTDEMAVMTEEIFGPLLPIKIYDDIEEAISYINDRPRPLGLYYFGSNKNEELAVIHGTVSGGVSVNDVIAHIMQDDAPFGGVGPSGMGAYHGHEGFKNFSHGKTVYAQTPLDFPLKLFRPPYRKGIQRFLDLMIRK